MKIIGLAVLALAILASPALAQRGGSRGGQRGGERGGEQRGSHETSHQRVVRGHYDGRHFDENFRTDHFGRGNIFTAHIGYYGGGYRFYYSDFWFGFDFWPAGWVPADGVYIDTDAAGFIYLYNPIHPGVRIALTVIL